jgi:O-antigen/teichoic acid export membrane protein
VFTVFVAVINIILKFFLIKLFGLIGATLASLIAKFVLIIGLKKVYKKFVNIDYSTFATIGIPVIYFFFSLIVFTDINLGSLIFLYVFIILTIITMVRDKLKELYTLKNK